MCQVCENQPEIELSESFLNRHPALFFVWAVANRIKYLRSLQRQERAAQMDALSVRMADLREALA